MIDFLSYYAQSTLWSAPRADTQYILDMARITPVVGVWNKVRYMFQVLPLPEKKTKFHVFQIGQLQPELLGLMSQYQGRWVRADVGCEMLNMLITPYLVNGIMYPRHRIWYQWTDDKNLLFAFADVPELKYSLEEMEPYVRVYTGSWFHILRKDRPKDMIKIKGLTINSEKDRQDIYNFAMQYAKSPGHVFTWINGVYTSPVALNKLKMGDLVEYLYDSTVYKKIKVRIKDLNSFDSIRDKKRKYLITYAGMLDNPTIDYHDDIDYYITATNDKDPVHVRGVYYHKNMTDSVRQLTHRDYSITVPYVAGLINAHAFMKKQDIGNQFVELFVRRSGFMRGIPFVHNRIHELYKLSYANKVAAMLGVRSNVKVWRADELEQSAYTGIMGHDEQPRDKKQIMDAYGYNALSVVLGNTPVKKSDFRTDGGIVRVELPVHLQYESCHFEYDEEGKLIGYYNSQNNCSYPIRNQNCHLVESMAGFASDYFGDVFNPANGTSVGAPYDYRLYRCEKGKEYQNTPSNWEDITDLAYHRVVDGKLQWVQDMKDTHSTLLRINNKVLVRELNVKIHQGILTFPLVQKAEVNGRIVDLKPMVPMGQLDVFMNGYSLVEGIDYLVDFPTVVITSKKYIQGDVEQDVQKVIIRMSNFCNPDMSRLKVKETGYIYDGQLSNNKVYNIFDNKVLRIVAAGGVFHRSEVGLFEKKSKVTKPYLLTKEGYPYQIRDIIVPLRQQVPSDTQKLREASEVVDDSISNYMTQFQEKKVLPRHPAIKELYPLYSPLLSRIIFDIKLKSHVFDEDKFYGRYTANDIREWLKQYEPLMKVDPLFNDESIDLEYVIIHPHILNNNIALTIYEYRLVSRIVDLLAPGKVSLSHYLRSIPVQHGP